MTAIVFLYIAIITLLIKKRQLTDMNYKHHLNIHMTGTPIELISQHFK